MHTGNLVLNILGVSPISCSHKAGTPDQDLIRADREFPGVQPISQHTQKTPIHKGLGSADCTMIVSRKCLNVLPLSLSVKLTLYVFIMWHCLTWLFPSTPSPARPQPAVRPARWRAEVAGGHRPPLLGWILSSRQEKLQQKGANGRSISLMWYSQGNKRLHCNFLIKLFLETCSLPAKLVSPEEAKGNLTNSHYNCYMMSRKTYLDLLIPLRKQWKSATSEEAICAAFCIQTALVRVAETSRT